MRVVSFGSFSKIGVSLMARGNQKEANRPLLLRHGSVRTRNPCRELITWEGVPDFQKSLKSPILKSTKEISKNWISRGLAQFKTVAPGHPA